MHYMTSLSFWKGDKKYTTSLTGFWVLVIFCDGLWGSSLKDLTFPTGPVSPLRNQDEILKHVWDHLLVQWVLPSVCYVILAPILLMGWVVFRTQSTKWVGDICIHRCATHRRPAKPHPLTLFFFPLLSGLHWGLGCTMPLFPTFFWVFSIFNCSLDSRLMLHSTHSTLKISQWQ